MSAHNPLSPATPTTVPASGRRETLSVANFKALTAPKPAGKGKTKAGPPKPRSAKEIAAEQAARREVVGVGRLAWTNTTFGVPLACRKYLLADEQQGDQLDVAFYSITGTQPQ